MNDGAGVVVYGATGLTGGMLVDALIARGVQPRIAGRSEAKLRALAARVGLPDDSIRTVDADSPSDLAHLVDGAKVLVSCAGPFLEVGEPIVAACATHGVHYADSTGEAPFVQMIARRYEATARATGCALVPSSAFEVAVSDAAADKAAEGLGEDLAMEIAYSTRDGATSQGTRASVMQVLAHSALALDRGEVHEEPLAHVVRRVKFPAPLGEQFAASFGSPEVLTVPRHVRVRSLRVFMASRWARALHYAAPAVTALARMGASAASTWVERFAGSTTSEARAHTHFDVVVEARRPDGRGRRVTVSGSDPYRLSAALLAECARVLAEGAPAAGLLAPSQVLGPDRVFALVRSFPSGSIAVDDLS